MAEPSSSPALRGTLVRRRRPARRGHWRRSQRTVLNPRTRHFVPLSLSLQEFLVDAKSQYRIYEDAFLQKVKDELMTVREGPGTALGTSAAAALLILRDLMDDLREIPGREALKLGAEDASMASNLKQQRVAMEKRKVKISELGVDVYTQEG